MLANAVDNRGIARPTLPLLLGGGTLVNASAHATREHSTATTTMMDFMVAIVSLKLQATLCDSCCSNTKDFETFVLPPPSEKHTLLIPTLTFLSFWKLKWELVGYVFSQGGGKDKRSEICSMKDDVFLLGQFYNIYVDTLMEGKWNLSPYVYSRVLFIEL